MMLAIGTWVEFTSFQQLSDGEVLHVHNATGVVVDSWVLDGNGYYMVQHYEGDRPGPEPSCHCVRDHPLMIRTLMSPASSA